MLRLFTRALSMLHSRTIAAVTYCAITTACAVPAIAQSSAAQSVTVVRVDRRTLAYTGVASGLVVVVRDADLPDRLLPTSAVAVGPPGVDPRTGDGRFIGFAPDSTRRVIPDTGNVTVLALNIGYARFRFDIHLEPMCHQ